MAVSLGTVSGQDPQCLAEHASVGPELAAVLEGSPDGSPGTDRVNGAEHGFAGFEVGAVAVGDCCDDDLGVDRADVFSGGGDLELAEVAVQVALGGDIGGLDGVEVDQLDAASAEGGELEGDLSTDGSDADDGAGESSEFVVRDEVLLANKAGHGEGLWIGGMRGRGTSGSLLSE